MESTYTIPHPRVTKDNKKQVRLFSLLLLVVFSVGLITSLFFKESWLWMDEVLSYTLLEDPSLAHMNDAIVSNIDANPPLFFEFYWLLGHGVSLSPYFLRAISILLFASTIALLYRYTTRLVGTAVTNFVIFTVVVSLTYLNFLQSTQIRSYSFYLLLSCLYFFTLHKLIRNPAKPSLLATHLLIGLSLVMTHNFGSFYVSASLTFFGLLLLWSKQRTYGLVILSHLLIFGFWFLLWFPNFQIQSQLAKPHTWIPLPTFVSFFRTLGELIPTLSSRIEQMPAMVFLPILRVCFVVGLFLYIAIPRLKKGFQSVVNDDAFSFYLLAGYIAISVTGATLLISYAYLAVFISRYQWPSSLLLLFQLVYAFYYFVPALKLSPKLVRWLPLYVIGLLAFVFYQNQKIVYFPKGILSYLPENKANYPIFFESADYYLPIHHHKTANAHFLLSWQTALAKDNATNATVDHKIIESIRDKYGVREIVPIDEFTKQRFPHFYVVDQASRRQIEYYVATGQVKVIRTIPVPIEGHQILECSFQE